uniref:Uncharacterized protein n=1 Tax=Glossina pallidipes TaxID=7398 RepID=A0A1B0AD14_GLOPL
MTIGRGKRKEFLSHISDHQIMDIECTCNDTIFVELLSNVHAGDDVQAELFRCKWQCVHCVRTRRMDGLHVSITFASHRQSHFANSMGSAIVGSSSDIHYSSHTTSTFSCTTL